MASAGRPSGLSRQWSLVFDKKPRRNTLDIGGKSISRVLRTPVPSLASCIEARQGSCPTVTRGRKVAPEELTRGPFPAPASRH